VAKASPSREERREAATSKALTAAVDHWAKAWSRRDSRAYLKAYAPGFISADRTMGHATWAERRRQSLADSHTIRIDIRELQWDARGTDWVGSFVEASLIDGRYRETRKQLLMRRFNERWLIIGEREDG
jgi:ketosteroid isomerase-like protein